MNYRYLLLGLSCALNVFLLWILIWGGTGYLAYKDLEREHAALNKRIAALKEQWRALDREIRLSQSSPRYLEQAIRKRLNFVRDNEILYIFPGEKIDERDAQTLEGVNEPKN